MSIYSITNLIVSYSLGDTMHYLINALNAQAYSVCDQSKALKDDSNVLLCMCMYVGNLLSLSCVLRTCEHLFYPKNDVS